MSTLDTSDKAELIIRADDAARASRIVSALRRWRRRGGHDADAGRSLTLEIDDLRGRRHASVDHAGAVTRLLLPVGTYVVTATCAGRQRRYTLALQLGVPCELDVRSSPA